MQQNNNQNSQDLQQSSSMSTQNKYIFVDNNKALIDSYNQSARQSKTKAEMTSNFIQAVNKYPGVTKQSLSQMCSKHNQPFIVTLQDDKLACNACMFEHNNFESEFLSMYCKKLYQNYLRLYVEYRNNFDKMSLVETEKIREQFKKETRQIVDKLTQQLNELEQQLLAKVKRSQVLSELKEKSFSFTSYKSSSCKNFEFEKKKFDSKITDQDYVSIVRQQQFYKRLFQEMQEFTEKQVEHTTFIKNRSQRVVNVKYSNEQTVQDLQDSHMEYLDSLKPKSSEKLLVQKQSDYLGSQQVQVQARSEEILRVSRNQQTSSSQSVIQQTQQTQLVQESRITMNTPSETKQEPKLIQQDTQPAQVIIDDSEHDQIRISSAKESSVQVLSTNHATQESSIPQEFLLKSAFRISQSVLQRLDSKSKCWIKLEGLPCPKLGRLINAHGYCYMIGGAQSSIGEMTQNCVTKLSLNEKDILIVEEKAQMQSCRCAFGCAYSTQLRQIVVCGGLVHRGTQLPNCELYDEDTNSWTSLPDLNQAVAQSTVSILDNKHVYCLGGSGKYPERADQIEHFELGISTKWTVLNVKLPQNLVLAGCLPLSNSKLLIFGGKKSNFQESSEDCYLFEAVTKKDNEGQTGSQRLRIHDKFDFTVNLLSKYDGLKAADAFPCTGFAVEDQSQLLGQYKVKSALIFGTSFIHKYDLTHNKFISFMKAQVIDKKDK